MTTRSDRHVALLDVVGSNGLFTDGDWVESKDQDPSGDIRLVQLADVGVGEYLNRSKRFLTSVKARELGCTFLRPGDLLIARMPDPLGRACVFPGDPRPCVTVVDVCILRPDAEIADTRWLMWALNASPSREFLVRFTSGSTRPRISRGNLGGLPLRLPPLPEQRRIAALLDKADAIRRKRQLAIHLTDDLVQSVYLALVGPGSREYDQWPIFRIEKLADPKPGSMRTGPFGSALRHSEFVEEGIAVLGIDNAVQNRFAWAERRFITPDKYAAMARYTVKPGDVIITIMGTTGRSAVVPDGVPVAISTKHLATITVDRTRVHPEFLSNAIHRDPQVASQLQARNRGAIMSGLNLGLIRSLELRLPPIGAQARFAAAVSSIRRLEARYQAYSDRADHLFHSLVQRAFGGGAAAIARVD